MKKTRIISLIFGCLAIAIFCLSWYVLRNFGEVHIAQIIFNMGIQITGVDNNYIKSAYKFSVLCVFLMLVWCIVVYRYKYVIAIYVATREKYFSLKKKILSSYNLTSKNRKKESYVICAVSIVMLVISIFFMSNKFHAIELIENEIRPEIDYIKENYFIPSAQDIKFDKKNNIVVVLVESMENTFSSNNIMDSLIPSLDKFRHESQYNTNMVQTYGTGWTIAAFTSWGFGVPLKLPKYVYGNSYISKRGFLPNAKSIFDVLRENDYELVMIMGSDSKFSGLDILLKGHGNFRILDKSFWVEKQWSLQDNQGTAWGFNDRFILNRALDEYKKLSKTEKPFALFIQTIDTHTPKGYCPPEKIKFNDIRDAILEVDAHLGKFISSFKEIDNKNDVLAIIGDHNFMGAITFYDDKVYRTIYNAFYGNVGVISNLKKEQKITAVDIAPTLLHCAGAKWKNNNFGIGVSLFSDEPSLIEKTGEDQFQQNLEKFSEFYTKFY